MKNARLTERRTLLTAGVSLLGLSALSPATLAAPIVVGASRNVPLEVPAPRKITGHTDEKEVRDAIVEVAERLHWRILCQIMPGEVRMVYLRGDRLEVDVKVTYSANEFAVHYLGSRGLYEEKTEDGKITLQRKGNVLLADLDRVIARRLGAGLPAPSGDEHGEEGKSDSHH